MNFERTGKITITIFLLFNFSSLSTQSQTPDDDKVLHYVSHSGMSSFDLTIDNDGFTTEIKDMIDGRLYYYDTSYLVNGELRPELADGLPVLQPDNKTYHVKLKDGLKFSNGNPLTADDVVFSFNVLMTPLIHDDDYFPEILESNTSVYKIDDTMIAFETTGYQNVDLDFFAFGSILDQTTYVDRYNNCLTGVIRDCNWNNEYLISAGPFMVDKYFNNQIDLIQNPYYHEKILTDRIKISINVPREEAINMFQSNVGDIFYDLYRFLPTDINDSNTEYTTTGAPQSVTELMDINHLHPIYGTGVDIPDNGDTINDQEQAKLVRQAMSYAVNREGISLDIWTGSEPAYTILTPGVLKLENIENGIEYDISYAKGLMESAGFNYSNINDTNGDGDYGDTGDTTFFDISYITLNNSNFQRLQHVDRIIDDLTKIGIGMKINQVGESFDLYARVYYGCFVSNTPTPLYEDGGYDALFAGAGYKYRPEFRDTFSPDGMCGSGEENEGDNIYNYVNPTLDGVVKEFDDEETTYDRKIELFKQIQTILYEEVVEITIVHPEIYILHKSDVKGLKPISMTFGYPNWIDIYKDEWLDDPSEDESTNDITTILIVSSSVVLVVITGYFLKNRILK